MRRKAKENDPDSIPKQTPNPLDTNPADQPSPVHEPTDASVPNRIQILDLHTSNPLISYQSQLYTCAWTTTIGTDMILSPTTQGPSPLLFTTRHKLLARPASLTPHVGAPSSSSPPSLPPPLNPPDACLTPHDLIDQPPSSTTTNTKPAIIPLDTRSSLARQRQTAFLERLMAAKVARGETDQVTVHSQRRLTGTGWRSRNKVAAIEEAEAEADDVDEGFSAEGENGGGSSRQGREKTPKRARIGRPRGRGRHRNALFGNYRPDSGEILVNANPSTSSTSNLSKEGHPPQQVSQQADQHGAISPPPAQIRADQDEGMVSSAASVQTPIEPTKDGEDVIMQNS